MITYPKTPLSKPRMTRADTWKKRPIVLRYWEYKDDIKSWAKLNNFTLGCEIICKLEEDSHVYSVVSQKLWDYEGKIEFYESANITLS